LAGRLTEVQVRLKISANSTAWPSVLDDLPLWNGREVAGNTNTSSGKENYCCSTWFHFRLSAAKEGSGKSFGFVVLNRLTTLGMSALPAIASIHY
jgi:hypothetical protein